MTAHPSRSGPHVAAAVRSVPFGWYTLVMLRAYAQNVTIVTVALLSIALTSDIAIWVWREIAYHPAAGWWQLTGGIGSIVALRALDLLPQVCPIAFFIGVLWAEAAFTWTRLRLVVWNTGRSPMQCLIPIALLATTSIPVQFVLDAHLRPAAVLSMEGKDLNAPPRAMTRGDEQKALIPAGHDLIDARIARGSPPQLFDLTIYRLDEKGQLIRIISAASARPADTSGMWRLTGSQDWSAFDGPRGRTDDRTDAGIAPREIEIQDVPLALDSPWLTAYGIHPQYLPFDILSVLATRQATAYRAAPYRVWYYGRFSRAVLPATMALLATSMSLWLLAYRVSLAAVFVIALAGYAAHVLVKIFTVLGEHEIVYPLAAIWCVPLLIILGCASMIIGLELKRRRAVSSSLSPVQRGAAS